LQVELVGVELEALRVVEGGARLHAEQRRVRLGVVSMCVVAVVGREQRDAEVARELDELRIDAVLLGEAVVLELDEERVTPEDRLEASHEIARAVVVVGKQGLGDGTAEATGGGDQTGGVL